VPTVRLSFLNPNRGTIKQICRVCRERAEIKAEQLCTHCVWIKSQLSARFAEAVHGAIAIPRQQHCERYGCSCAACDGKTLAPHPLYVFDLGGSNRREIHFHPRCHDLWLEVVNGPNRGPEPAADIAQG